MLHLREDPEQRQKIIDKKSYFLLKGKLSPAKNFQNIPYKGFILTYKNVLSVFFVGVPKYF